MKELFGKLPKLNFFQDTLRFSPALIFATSFHWSVALPCLTRAIAIFLKHPIKYPL